MNFGLLPQIRLFLVRINLQSFYLCTKMCVDDASTFVENGGYHFEEEVEMNSLGPRNSSESGQRTALLRLQHALPPPSMSALHSERSWSQLSRHALDSLLRLMLFDELPVARIIEDCH